MAMVMGMVMMMDPLPYPGLPTGIGHRCFKMVRIQGAEDG